MSGSAFEHFDFTDDFGPEKVVTVYEPRCGLEGIVVIDNSAAGPTMGGIRMAPDVSVEEVCRLARAMTWKNAMARLRHGGGKAGIRANPRTANREALIRQFGRAIRQLTDYIPAPDMGTNETAMAWIRDEGGRSVGLSRSLGGIPLDESGSTGFGLAILSIPDFVANAGGIICGAVEYAGGSERQAFERIEDTIRQNTREVLELARAEGCLLREAAMSIAQRRVSEAMAYRRAD